MKWIFQLEAVTILLDFYAQSVRHMAKVRLIRMSLEWSFGIKSKDCILNSLIERLNTVSTWEILRDNRSALIVNVYSISKINC